MRVVFNREKLTESGNNLRIMIMGYLEVDGLLGLVEDGNLRLVGRDLFVEEKGNLFFLDGEFTLLNHCTKLKDSFYNSLKHPLNECSRINSINNY